MTINNINNADLAIILGSGIQFEYPDIISTQEIKYTDIPDFPATTVQGHKGILKIITTKNNKTILVFQGRFHLYEGHDVSAVQTIVKFIKSHNINNLLITNAAGGISDQLEVNDLMLINSVKNYQIPTDNNQGLLSLIDQPVLEVNSELASKIKNNNYNFTLKQGRYVAVLGPNYESNSEVKFFRSQGCDAVGMSTYLELLYAIENNLNVTGISIITNSWANPSDEAPTHQEVLDNSKKSQSKINEIFKLLID